MKTWNWRTNLGGAISIIGAALLGIGVLPQLAQLSPDAKIQMSATQYSLLWYAAFAGVVLGAIGKGLTALFAADAAALKVVQSQMAQVPKAIESGDTSMLKRPETVTKTTDPIAQAMKIFPIITLLGALLLSSGCAGQFQVSPAVVQQGVASGVSYSSAKFPTAVPYLLAAGDVICSEANGTNLAPADVIAAIESSNASQFKTPEAVLILNSALTLYIGIWDSYGSNALANATTLQPYLKATCDGINQGLPPQGGKLMLHKGQQAPSPNWPMIKLP